MGKAVRAPLTCRLLATALVACTGACGPDAPPPPPPTTKSVGVDLEGPPEEAIRRLLATCHGPLAGAEEMSNCFLYLGDGDARDEIRLGEGRHMLQRHPSLVSRVRLEDSAWKTAPFAEPRRIAGEALTKFDRFQALLRAALLAPLYRAKRVTRQGPRIYAIILEGGETWRLELAAVPTVEGGALLPQTLEGPPGRVTFHEHLHTGITHLPRDVTLDEFGRFPFALTLSGIVFDRLAFQHPQSELKPTKQKLVVPDGYSPDPPWDEPGLREKAGRSFLVVADPGDWAGRWETMNEQGRRLAAQGQVSADLDFFFEEDGKRYIGMHFEMLPADQGGKPFVADKEQATRFEAAHRLVLVYPKAPTVAAKRKRAKELIAAFLEEKKLSPAGPLRWIPWIQLDRPMPSEEQLDRVRIGFEQPIE